MQLLVQANRADQMTVERLLRTLDLKDSPRDVEVLPKPRMIAVEHARRRTLPTWFVRSMPTEL